MEGAHSSKVISRAIQDLNLKGLINQLQSTSNQTNQSLGH